MPPATIVIAPGVSHFPSFLDRAAQEALRDEVPGDPRVRAAVSPAHAAQWQAVFGSHEQLRRARLGLGQIRLSLPADPPRNRAFRGRRCRRGSLPPLRAIAPDAPPPEACLINLYNSSSPDGPARGPGTKRTCPPPSCPCRSAIRRCSGSAGFSATRRPAHSASRPATRCRLPARAVSRSTASTASSPDPRPFFWPKAAGSI